MTLQKYFYLTSVSTWFSRKQYLSELKYRTENRILLLTLTNLICFIHLYFREIQLCSTVLIPPLRYCMRWFFSLSKVLQDLGFIN